jgi:putative DNA modification/repair radical SAM protein
MQVQQKLAILADAAKYDASCSSSGIKGRSAPKGGIGSAEGSGICHSYTPDGRCVSLLKILLTNHCIFDCAYCINRRSSGVRRARFTVAEVVDLTLAFYRRNYIEGLFLSSGIVRDSDYTMEQLIAVARMLRQKHLFAGYIHLKLIPGASPELLDEAARWADRLSVNVELPLQEELDALADGKKLVQIQGAMSRVQEGIEARRHKSRSSPRTPSSSRPSSITGTAYAPAGQSTQMIVGATPASDRDILGRASALYRDHGLRRVYYSGYSPIPDSSSILPASAPPLVREHRLYQADWLLRFYDFTFDELFERGPANLSLKVDPKTDWALRNRERFPVDVNHAAKEDLLRIPGLGIRNVNRMIFIRRQRKLRSEDLTRLNVPRRALFFMRVADSNRALRNLDALRLEDLVASSSQQIDLFASYASARSGEL